MLDMLVFERQKTNKTSPLVFTKSCLGHLQIQSHSMSAPKSHMSEVYKGFHSTSPNFTLPPNIACLCEMKATPVQRRLA